MNNGETSTSMVKKYRPLAVAAGIGSILGSGIIVGYPRLLQCGRTD